ncbi:bifunctional phosphoribosyl-AMP cyclohydrolase/phosphoribosyl-ATP diphosphatase HisIE [Patescibacteria group bacterium]|nr:MAG: bifunctional phosphoribosyl-AMP cyclohydrolase/phosphoribosyl-ATP diphosphatase HisIE [Patescibacteria group bacterium]
MESKELVREMNWEKVGGLVPAIIQDTENGLVLMLGYMNEEALRRTLDTGFVWFYSRTRKTLWKKGETSGNVLSVEDIRVDCDNDTVLVKARPTGPVCHTGDTTCFKEEATRNELSLLFGVLEQRKRDLPKGSYTTKLFEAGLDRIALKVAEESLEVIQAATKETRERTIEETTDLLYHLFVLLIEKNVTLRDVEKELQNRAGRKPREEKIAIPIAPDPLPARIPNTSAK